MLVHSLGLMLTLMAFADEPKSAALVQTLPADGSWVTFNVNVKVNDREFVLSATLRSVGQAFHGGKQCRLLEVEQTSDAPPELDIPQVGNLVWRVLIPEDEFGEGKDPISKAVKTWVKIDKAEPELVESVELKDPIFAMLIQGPKQGLKLEEAKEKISWQQGNLECAVTTGRNDSEFGIVKLSMTHRVFRHRDVPFGIAGMQQDLKISIGDEKNSASIRMMLRDHGKDAKARLPELVP